MLIEACLVFSSSVKRLTVTVLDLVFVWQTAKQKEERPNPTNRKVETAVAAAARQHFAMINMQLTLLHYVFILHKDALNSSWSWRFN